MKRALAAIFALVALSATGGRAATAALPYATGPGSQTVGWYVPAFVAHVGDGITFVNADTALHDFVASGAYGSDDNSWCGVDPITGLRHYPIGKCPIFWSPLIGLGQMTSVLGLDAVQPGAMYTFVCTIHAAMKGTLVVLPA